MTWAHGYARARQVAEVLGARAQVTWVELRKLV